PLRRPPRPAGRRPGQRRPVGGGQRPHRPRPPHDPAAGRGHAGGRRRAPVGRVRPAAVPGRGARHRAHRGDVRPGRPHAQHPGRRARQAAQDRGGGGQPGVAAGHPGVDRADGGRRRLGQL
ncbi:MAG: hypothetical protein AVDCRST_MAG16-2707, partial [uncultured Frankineae bacterium]